MYQNPICSLTELGWCAAIVLDSEDAAPLGEVAAVFLVLGTTLAQSVQALRGSFVIGSMQWHNTFVELKIYFRNLLGFSDIPRNLVMFSKSRDRKLYSWKGLSRLLATFTLI